MCVRCVFASVCVFVLRVLNNTNAHEMRCVDGQQHARAQGVTRPGPEPSRFTDLKIFRQKQIVRRRRRRRRRPLRCRRTQIEKRQFVLYVRDQTNYMAAI